MQKYRIEYIDRPETLQAAIAHLAKVPVFAFDLEFDSSRFSYGFTLCLIQIASSSRCFVIDPLAKFDLAPLFALFEDPKILKIAHCGEQDLRLLHSLQCRPKEVRDTETMAKLLNYEFIGLSYLIKEKFGVEMDKKLQVSNWNTRPLRPAQIDYAANDVIYLLDLHDILWKEAEAINITDWVVDETTANNNFHYIHEAEEGNFLTKTDIKECTEAEQYVLNQLLTLRDKHARKHNKPPYQIIDNQLLRDLVLGKEDFADWLSFKVYKTLRTHDFQEEIVLAYEKADEEVDALKLSRTTRPRLNPEQRAQNSRLIAERERQRLAKFRPIQAVIVERHGLNTSRYIFSESYITQILREQQKLSEINTPYRLKMIESIAKELNIDLSAYY